MSAPFDAGTHAVLGALRLDPAALLGAGGEAWVFALDDDRVARIPKPGAQAEELALRSALLSELSRSAERVPFLLPQILDERCLDDRPFTIERRLPGRTLTEELAACGGDERCALVHAYLDAADRIGDLALERPGFGEIARAHPIQAPDFRSYLAAAAARSLRVAGPDFAHLDPSALAQALPEAAAPSLVHLDAFPGNMLAERGRITAVLDFGPLAIVGDRRFDPLTAAAYLAPEITPGATPEDWQSAQQWLVAHRLDAHFEAAHRWLAAFWSGALDVPRLQAWSRRVLGICSRA